MPTLAEDKAIYVVNETDQDVEVSFKNPIRELGFAQIEHIIGLDTELSDGAYRTLSILHYFWQQKKSAYPSIETLAKLRGKSERTITEHLAELESKGIISRVRRLGTSSITYLEDLPQEYKDAAAAILQERKETKRKKSLDDTQKTSAQSGRKLPVRQEENFLERITREEEQVVGTTTFETGEESQAEKEITQIIFGLGWKERQEIRQTAENDVGLVSLKEALKDFRAKVESGEYRANWRTLKKFWANVISTNKLRQPALTETPDYQRNVQWANL